MKYSASLLAAFVGAASMVTTHADESPRQLQFDGQPTLDQKWNLTDPEFGYDSLSFSLDFPVSDYIKKNMPKYEIYTAPDCKDGENPIILDASQNKGPTTFPFDADKMFLDESGLAEGTPDPTEGANMELQSVTVNVTLDSENVVAANLTYPGFYTEGVIDNQMIAEIRFCVRFGLWTPSTTSVEVNFLETLITLTVDLTDGFEIGQVTVEPKDRLVRTANQAYEVIGYECTTTKDAETGNYYTPLAGEAQTRARNQGEVIRVCVEPEDEAKNDGIFMRSIDQFSFNRDTTIVQEAIVNAAAASNLLTSYMPDDCEGAYQCVFETILFAQFYMSRGSVDGAGVASMQFGQQNGRRQLRSGATSRNLQDDAAAGAAEFDLQFEVAEGTNVGSGAAGSLGVASVVAAMLGVAAIL